MDLIDFFLGKRGKTEQLSTMSPEQQEYLRRLYSGGGLESNPLFQSGSSYLQELLNGSPEAYERMSAPYLEQFNQQIVPGLAQTFAGAGTGSGALSSSGFQQSLAQAGRGLQSDLAAMREGMRMQGLNSALSYAQQPEANRLAGLGRSPFENVRSQGTMGLLPSFLSNIAGGYGGAYGYRRGYGGY